VSTQKKDIPILEYTFYNVKSGWNEAHGFLKIRIWDILSTDTSTGSAGVSQNGRTLRSVPSFYGGNRAVRVFRGQKVILSSDNEKAIKW